MIGYWLISYTVKLMIGRLVYWLIDSLNNYTCKLDDGRPELAPYTYLTNQLVNYLTNN